MHLSIGKDTDVLVMGMCNMTSPLIPTAERQDISQTAVYMHTSNHFFSLDWALLPRVFCFEKAAGPLWVTLPYSRICCASTGNPELESKKRI